MMTTTLSTRFTPAAAVPEFLTLPKLAPGDRVAVLSPSSGVAGVFPHVFEAGLQQLEVKFGLRPIEFPTTRRNGAPLADRAADIMAAFADRSIKGILTSLGGDDQINLLHHLDPNVIRANAKPFFGYSDNTHLVNFLWNLGVPSFYGGAIMIQFAMPGGLHSFTERYLRAAIFDGGELPIERSSVFTEEEISWEDIGRGARSPTYHDNEPWVWDGDRVTQGVLWGGCVESLEAQLADGRWLPRPEALSGAVLCLETSEELPSPQRVVSVIRGLGSSGYLERLTGLLVARAKAYHCMTHTPDLSARASYRAEQREAVRAEFRAFNPTAPIVMGLDFGHTDPQIPMPMGRTVRIDPAAKTIVASFD